MSKETDIEKLVQIFYIIQVLQVALLNQIFINDIYVYIPQKPFFFYLWIAKCKLIMVILLSLPSITKILLII